ncbi:CRISPR-associated endonuclease Cas2 [Paenibacillus sp. BIHB 4019]|uniref:CRISPR-associated endoribonuclease Cas2 n=1 Tax=Paenibacillus sp. BIHB 4019 TaxID=1870819 RepID=A0A1B2DR20_9BACL|nr:CRISPR-associated endonuclease Cas2 [Paenibacillus sp. BIHB 4019]ANY70164.1 CRISPR-associated endonuclease Cas2 [Paenibacillus sp. BIHB 4019]
MMILVTYDVNTTTPEGRRRLRQVAKCCLNYGQRVQNSVFECIVDPLQFKQLKDQLSKEINENTDSLRYYLLGANWKKRVEHVGAKEGYDPEGILIVD